jgi:co-chaperonin GroES (HSP10)
MNARNTLSQRLSYVWFQAVVVLLFATATLVYAASTKVLGTVKSINGTSLALKTDGGSEATITLTDSTHILKVLPGQSMKDATPIQASDIKVGDRVLAAGQPGEANTTVASTVVVMKQSDIAGKQQQEREEWRRGVGGIVREVNAPAGTITLANSLASGAKPVLIHVSSATIIRRYSPDSVKFDDAKPGTLEEIKPGDQLRARGEKSADGQEFTAQAIVSGTFKQIAGTVISSDAATASLTVMDLVTKKPVTLKVTPDSQMRKLPQFVAQRLAMRIRGTQAPGGASANAGANGAQPASPHSGSTHAGAAEQGAETHQAQGGRGQGNWRAAGSSGPPPGGPTSFGGGGGTPDFQQILSRMPSVTLADLQKGDAVMLVATEGSATSAPTTITLLAGVEPILTAAPSGAAAATILSPWNLGASPGGDAASE